MALGDTVTPRELGVALRCYTRNAGYLRSLRAGAERVDLAGDAAGAVRARQAGFAMARLKGLRPSACAPTSMVLLAA